MEEIGKKYFENKIKNFKFLSNAGKKKARNRINDINHLSPKITKHDYILRDHNDLPKIEFMGAVEKYLVGFFYESLQNSINSVELALLVKLTVELPEKEKRELNSRINSNSNTDRISFTFGYMKNTAIQHRIIQGKRTITVFDQMTEIRNTIYHPANLMNLLLSQQQPMIPEFDNFIEQFEKIENSTLVRLMPYLKNINNLAKYGKNALEKTDAFEWSTRENSNVSVRNQISTLIEETMKEGQTLRKEIEMNPIKMLKVPDFVKRTQEEGILKHLALNTINVSFEALEYLKFF